MEIFNIILPIITLIFGFYAGFKLAKEKELPKVPEKIKHPIEEIKKNKDEKEIIEEIKEIQTDLETLDNFTAGL